jgi:hypothetical protein
VARDGYLVVNSGYGLYFHMPGNVMLVFAAAGKESGLRANFFAPVN